MSLLLLFNQGDGSGPPPDPDPGPEPTPRSLLVPPASARRVEETIILRGEGGQWMVVGTDAARGIVHEGLSLSADRSGPSTCSFTLRRDPTVSWPDLSPFNDVIVEIGGVRVWSGRMREAPGQSGASDTISFTASGWQTHLDDDLIAMGWVHTRLSDWVDASTLGYGIGSAGTVKTGLGTVTNDGRDLLIGLAPGVIAPSGLSVARATLDLGSHHTGAFRVAFEVSMDHAAAGTELWCHGHTSPVTTTGGAAFDGISSWNMTSGTRYVRGGVLSTPYRYLSLTVLRPALGNYTSPADGHHYRVHRFLAVAAASGLSSGIDSNLRASTVIRDVLASGSLPHLSQDTSRIQTTSFFIPDYWPPGHQSPRELMEPVNAFHDWHLGVDVDRRVFFEPTTDIPDLEIGEWSGAEFTDASAGSGEDVFNKVIVQAQDASGRAVDVIRTAGTAAPELATRIPIDSSVANPSFEVNTSGWTLFNGFQASPDGGARTAGGYHGSWALKSGNAVSGANLPWVRGPVTGLTPGWGHVLSFAARYSGTAHSDNRVDRIQIMDYPGGQPREVIANYAPATPLGAGWALYSYIFVPKSDQVLIDIILRLNNAAVSSAWIDDIRVSRLEVSSVDRHGFGRAQRLPVNAPLTEAAAEVLGDTWLRNHLRTPFKGSVTVTGPGGVRQVVGGAPVHPAHLLLYHGRALRHSNMADPDTGAWGRIGRIASVSYSNGQAVVELDNERHRLDALIARYAALAGQVA